MKQLLHNLKGDKVIWSFVALLALFSFIPVYSASSNLAYLHHGTGNTFVYLLKHFMHLIMGFVILYQVQKVPYHYFRSLSRLLLPFAWLLLVYTLLKGTMIEGANASRWIQVPFLGITFQPSAFASMALLIFVARYLSKTAIEEMTFQKSLLELWAPVFFTLMLILPANFSTAALIFSMVLMLTFIGKYPIKNIGIIIGLGILSFAFFILVVKAFPNAFPNRVDTWMSRIENFTSDKPGEDDYQIEKAKTAIATGGIYGLGPGKSIQKNFLPQSSSDFIFAIIIEEFGLLGGFAIMFLYIMLFIRFIIASYKAPTLFGKLLVAGLGFPIIFQAFINMGVAVELLPTTGQTLPLISSGGTSIWMTCAALGIIINVTKKEEEITEENIEKQKRDDALQKLIDKQLVDDSQEEDYTIEDHTNNPMNAVLNKK
ncbi:FtsW/RodA/SpoVE family cell cycle protein [Flavobacterium psychrophilum]|uniref:Probable peptidoglycan glycosyltransferase FtsW n=1 Tax=Flavobacterium psychrophilum TaxID=96345 RepID=A0A7U2RBY2_FLAPS|nr:FtsW/RodA/SpoVE family cell cycle protein [Flavobacterium psychrophilum]EKT3966714.1 FtsW/RodA/SpoVE family cell cycle protein [Flavobacterium psychrophilum]EKT4519369.1 FtsW/RodA/SpoVE family cell cycle protein [Flavobacterium psychrophilum]ELY2009112.1 FtsW/RodA/SpoVE family cell cycle protein [Flavobacterium psychrophilum]MCB6229765.1 FtsW/RodA/SpoVE family cell cycle protein [Flavobacterium psychrophilum]OAE92708.1 cell division protein FtsW [Flavobacterium psychrophilum]